MTLAFSHLLDQQTHITPYLYMGSHAVLRSALLPAAPSESALDARRHL